LIPDGYELIDDEYVKKIPLLLSKEIEKHIEVSIILFFKRIGYSIKKVPRMTTTRNTLPSTQQILDEANSPEVQTIIAQEAPQAGETQQQGTDTVTNIVNGCISDIPSCVQTAGVFVGAVTKIIAMLGL
jgi:hypothetical protein